MKVGNSLVVVIPPHVLDHIGVVQGDLVTFDLTVRHFAVLARAPIPPYLVNPDLIEPVPENPGE
jgi:hypothetical protein